MTAPRLETVDLPLGEKIRGKVRDMWDVGDRRVIVTTDRQSAFDVVRNADRARNAPEVGPLPKRNVQQFAGSRW